MAQEVSRRLSTIAQWLQREEDTLLYTPDGADDIVQLAERVVTSREDGGQRLTFAQVSDPTRWPVFFQPWEPVDRAFTPEEIAAFGSLPEETRRRLYLATVETPLFLLAADHRRAVWLRDFFRWRRRYRQMHIVHRHEDLYGYDRPIVFLVPSCWTLARWEEWCDFLQAIRAQVIQVRF